MRRKLSALGFQPRRVAKSKPLRKVPQTDAIFEAVHRINREADADLGTIRLSIDTKTGGADRAISAAGARAGRRTRRWITIWNR